MYMYMYMYMYMSMYVYMYMYMLVYMYLYIYTCKCKYYHSCSYVMSCYTKPLFHLNKHSITSFHVVEYDTLLIILFYTLSHGIVL